MKCERPCADGDTHCRYCGYPILRPKVKRWHLEDWWSPRALFLAFAGVLGLFLIRLALQGFFMPYLGERNEGRLILYHVLMSLSLGAILAVMRQDRAEAWLWLILGFWAGLLSWFLDYAYMADYLGLQAVWKLASFIREDSGPRSMRISFGVLTSLRYLGSALCFTVFSAWRARPMPRLRMFLALALGLVLDFTLLPFALSFQLLSDYPRQSLLFVASYGVLLYGLGIVDDHGAK